MAENMTAESNPTTSLPAWWETQSFTGKEQYELKESGELVLKAFAGYPERQITHFNNDNADAAMTALQEKFVEVAGKLKDLQAEWCATDDHQKMIGKVERMKEYLKHTNAVGDFHSLIQPLAVMDKAICELAEENYKAKLLIVETAEEQAKSEDWKEATQRLRDLTEQWKQVGHTDKQKSDELWSRFEAAKNNFYDRKRQNHEEFEKEMLQNLDLKMELVDKAENLAGSEDWKETTDAFKQLMDEWKQIGKTIPEKNEELWNRFIQAKNVFYDRKKQHFESIQEEQEANATLKEAVIAKAEEMKESTDWGNTSKAYAELMKEWKSIGRVPLERSEELWDKFNAAKDHFFNAKRQHFETLKVSLEDNYAQKMALLKRAEALQNSRQWREATAEMNELMTEWKEIGPVPREHSNAIWEQFLAARKHFFKRKDEDREKRQQHAQKQRYNRVHQTREFLYKLEDELKEEEDRLADFEHGIKDITPGHKEEELKAHLEKLITQTRKKVEHKKEKIDEVKNQLRQLEDDLSSDKA